MKTESSQARNLGRCGLLTVKALVVVLGLLAVSCANASAASVTYDFNTDTGLPNFCGTLWDGLTVAHTGSVNWKQTGGGGPVGGSTNGPNYGVPGDGFLQLTFASPTCDGHLGSFLCGAWLLDDFDQDRPLSGFNFECDLRMGNGDPAPVGGFSVNFVRANDPVLMALDTGDTVQQMNGQVSPNGGRFSDYGNAGDLSLMDEGATTGLSVAFQMADYGDYHIPPDAGAVGLEIPGITHDGIGLHVRVDRTVIAAVPMPNGTTQQTYDQQGNPLTASDPSGSKAATDFGAVETGLYNGIGCDTNLLWVHFKMELSTNGLLNVWWKNSQVITNLPTGLPPFNGRFLIAARAGSKPGNIELDNASITTVVFVPTIPPPTISIVVSNGQMIITYTGTLQYSLSATGPYLDWTGANSPFTVPLVHLDATPGTQVFFRSR